jgi:hypothetical protein
MKQKTILGLTIMLWFVKANAQTLDVQFNTTPPIKGDSLKSYNIVVWVEDEYGKFISTLLVYADNKKQLVKWYAKTTGSTGNAITGGTLSTAKKHYINWDCRKFNGAFISLGKYKLCLESSSVGEAETYHEVPISIFYKAYEIKRDDLTFFPNLVISFTPITVTGKSK